MTDECPVLAPAGIPGLIPLAAVAALLALCGVAAFVLGRRRGRASAAAVLLLVLVASAAVPVCAMPEQASAAVECPPVESVDPPPAPPPPPPVDPVIGSISGVAPAIDDMSGPWGPLECRGQTQLGDDPQAFVLLLGSNGLVTAFQAIAPAASFDFSDLPEGAYQVRVSGVPPMIGTVPTLSPPLPVVSVIDCLDENDFPVGRCSQSWVLADPVNPAATISRATPDVVADLQRTNTKICGIEP